MTTKKTLTTIASEDTFELTLHEVCHTIQADEDLIIEMIEYELIIPKGTRKETYRFDSACLLRLKRALSFYHDLHVNLAGISLAFELLDQMESLEQELKRIKKTFK